MSFRCGTWSQSLSVFASRAFCLCSSCTLLMCLFLKSSRDRHLPTPALGPATTQPLAPLPPSILHPLHSPLPNAPCASAKALSLCLGVPAPTSQRSCLPKPEQLFSSIYLYKSNKTVSAWLSASGSWNIQHQLYQLSNPTKWLVFCTKKWCSCDRVLQQTLFLLPDICYSPFLYLIWDMEN